MSEKKNQSWPTRCRSLAIEFDRSTVSGQ